VVTSRIYFRISPACLFASVKTGQDQREQKVPAVGRSQLASVTDS